MKRNKKAEARKRRRHLNRRQAELKRISILLSEMEDASAAVLAGQFGFTPEQIAEFTEHIRARYQAFSSDFLLFSTKKRLSIVAQRFGLAGMQVLSEFYGFTPEQNDAWVKGMIEQGNKQREEVVKAK